MSKITINGIYGNGTIIENNGTVNNSFTINSTEKLYASLLEAVKDHKNKDAIIKELTILNDDGASPKSKKKSFETLNQFFKVISKDVVGKLIDLAIKKGVDVVSNVEFSNPTFIEGLIPLT